MLMLACPQEQETPPTERRNPRGAPLAGVDNDRKTQ